MSKSLRKVRMLTVVLLAVIAFCLAALMTAIGAAAEGNVSTTERENTYTAGTVKRAIKVENDSFSVHSAMIARMEPQPMALHFSIRRIRL